ncbi:uncharacterized protein A4U43_C08F15110 [Asparagus officinalis]|nr:uncharacterized protein A4U43_C08F15110 [Asparagus officinalis]
MGLSFFLIEIVLPTLLLNLTASIISAQSTDKNITDFSCSASPCKTYVTYRTQPPDYIELGQVSDLFGVSRLSIMTANNLPSEDVTFFPDQLVFVPILCGCTGNRSFVNTTYEIKAGDSFYFVSISAFENLTDYQVVQDSNPMLVPASLKVGQEVIFPIYCQCPSKTQLDQGFKFLVTYVWQREDDISSLSRKMNTSSEAIVIANNYRNFSDAIAFPILIPVSRLPLLPSRYYNTSSREKQNAKSNTALVLVSSLLGSVLALILLSFLVIAYCKQWPRKCLARITSSHF